MDETQDKRKSDDDSNGAVIAFILIVVICIIFGLVYIGLKGAKLIWQLTKSRILAACWLVWHFGFCISIFTWKVEESILTEMGWGFTVYLNEHFWGLHPMILYISCVGIISILAVATACTFPEKVTIYADDDENTEYGSSSRQKQSKLGPYAKTAIAAGSAYVGYRAGWKFGRDLL